MNARFQTATHILTLLHHMQGQYVSSDFIAGSINANPALIRKELSALRKVGLIESKEGKSGGYLLAKPSGDITMADVYQTVKAVSPFGLSKNQPNPACPIGKQINQHIITLYNDVDNGIIKQLKSITLADFSNKF